MNEYDDGVDDGYDVAQICLKGHVANSRMPQFPDEDAGFCTTCGSPTITTCQRCAKEIRGLTFGFEPGLDYDSYVIPGFCHACGTPYPWNNSTQERTHMSPRIFISHASNDVDLVRALVDVLSKAFHLPPGDIRCTSLPGHAPSVVNWEQTLASRYAFLCLANALIAYRT